MPVSDYSTYKTLRDSASMAAYYKLSAGEASGKLQSSWTSVPFAGSAPTTATACNNGTTGAITWERLGLHSAPTKVRRLAFLDAKQVNTGTASNTGALLIDRLSHQGGLSAIVTTAQTTNLPTAALTRHTSGEGVMIALELYSIIGTTATTVTVSYTNQAGTAGQITYATAFGGTGNRAAGLMLILPLADGDTGVRSVESVTVLATTGTAGNFGVTLIKILDWCPVTQVVIPDGKVGYDAFLGGGGLCPVVDNNACLQLCVVANATSNPVALNMKFIEDDV